MRAFSPRNASLSLAHARDLLSQPLWRCLKDWSSTHSSSKAAAMQVAEGDSDGLRERSEHLRNLRVFRINQEMLHLRHSNLYRDNPEKKMRFSQESTPTGKPLTFFSL